ncbi:hypothetical protein CLV58_12571 [Spirosoma oryzae]|uniref:Uncharacterized protein n=1 Tax=Spirosoma oryzae TaxID=1469603 RepID=A0A2T0S8Q4_9BACT|nr:hypothetical protein [Spirosoma oryzae]PRY29809.1 hypothetical protein CLV58_12571 [Spirosoma oryzae]
MQAFLAQLELLLSTFPPTVLKILCPMAGSLCSAIVLAIATDVVATPKQIAGQFVVGWLAGGFCGPLLSPYLKLPDYTLGFVTGGVGYWGFTEYRKKKLKEIIDRQPPQNNANDATP